MEGLQQVYIYAVSMITPVGANASMTSAAIRAGISAYRESSVLGKHFEPLKIAPVPLSDDDLWIPEIPLVKALYQQRRSRRMLGLAVAALNEILPSCPDTPIPVFLAGPESIPVTAIDGYFLSLLANAAPTRIDLASSRLIATGRSGGLQAIDLAFRYLSQTGAPCVLIGGVDSLIDLKTLGIWASEDRIASSNVADGFTPGEGAAFILLSKNANSESLGTVRPPGIAVEPGHRYSAEPYRGEGMANAFKSVLRDYKGPLVEAIYSGLNGESFAAKEHGVAFTRNHQYLSPSFRFQHPADCFGDLGAAAAPVLIGLAISDIRSGRTRGPAIVCCSAEQEIRAACMVTG
ncbi:MAG TPA: beta-ketoacyl synthase N-terminal-like domain-containing protein [Cellvibrio sp.]|nr:beta-ketoacyl synthase N-terminal-like domain-containing protein [Cellvibrio sp.]